MKKLLTAEFDCEVITPMFIGGADSRGKPEIRPPSIRGGMRWWFRAMMGGIIEDNIKDLKKAEEFIFGSSEKTSAIIVKTFGDVSYKEYPRLPHKQGEKSAKRSAFDPGEYFRITISLSPYINGDEELRFNCAKYSLLLLLTFGGIGTRSRRGFGSLHADGQLDYIQLISGAIRTFTELKKSLNLTANTWTNIPSFPCLSKKYFKFWITEKNNTWEKYLIDLMKKMSGFKSMTHNRNFAIGGIDGGKRQASPLIVHAVKDADENIKLLFSNFITSQKEPFIVTQDDREELESYIQKEFNVKKMEVFL